MNGNWPQGVNRGSSNWTGRTQRVSTGSGSFSAHQCIKTPRIALLAVIAAAIVIISLVA